MSYIEKKYLDKIFEIFNEKLPKLEDVLLELLNKKSLKIADDIAKVCADFNRNVNDILKDFYPEIKDMDEKLKIKSTLKFYYDLIEKLTDLIRNIENFQKIDENYYEQLINFVKEKEGLISGKYKLICLQEITAFYNQDSRNRLEQIIAKKFAKRSREFFTFGSLEEEIKKIARIAGANKLSISSADNLVDALLFESALSVIHYSVPLDEKTNLKKIGIEIKKYLDSKGYKVELLEDSVITDAKLLPDKP